MKKNVGFIGCGNMGGALARATAAAIGGEQVYLCDAYKEKAIDGELSENNIGGRTISFEDTIHILTAFESHYPTKIEIAKVADEAPDLFEIKCSTRIRKPSAIANIEQAYAPFVISDIK